MTPAHRPEPASSRHRRMHTLQQRSLTSPRPRPRPRHDSRSSPLPPARPPALTCSSSPLPRSHSSRSPCHDDDNDEPSILPTHTRLLPLSLPLSLDGEETEECGPPKADLVRCHQPIGFVCCQCRYRSSGSYCSNPDRPNCPHRGCPRCGDCPILFTPPGRGWEKGERGR
ncbi:hypothetical protein F4810DRAFT_712193 [Camillea tinctor]|nr:hypothetical protein F4810DRAFT_712193 [Camillea tinctor]